MSYPELRTEITDTQIPLFSDRYSDWWREWDNHHRSCERYPLRDAIVVHHAIPNRYRSHEEQRRIYELIEATYRRDK